MDPHKVTEHTTTDEGTKRTFNLTVTGGELTRLQELIQDGRDSHFADVPTDTPDGASWWEQWEGEVEAGAFRP